MIPPYCFWFKETVEGTDLLYPQWQDIHNPDWVLGLFESDQDAAFEDANYQKLEEEYVIELLQSYHCAKTSGSDFTFYNMGSVAEFGGSFFKWFTGVDEEAVLGGVGIHSIEIEGSTEKVLNLSKSTPKVVSRRIGEAGGPNASQQIIKQAIELSVEDGGKLYIVLQADNDELQQEAKSIVNLFENSPFNQTDYHARKASNIIYQLDNDESSQVFTYLSSVSECTIEEISAEKVFELLELVVDQTTVDIESETMLVKLLDYVADKKALVDEIRLKPAILPKIFAAVDNASTRRALLRSFILLGQSAWDGSEAVKDISINRDAQWLTTYNPSFGILSDGQLKISTEVSRTSFSSNFTSAGSSLEFDSKTMDIYQGDPFAKVNIWNGRSHQDLGNNQGRFTLHNMPAVVAAFYIAKEEDDDFWRNVSITVDVALLATGVGETAIALKGLIETYRVATRAEKAVQYGRLLLGLSDNAAALLDIACLDGTSSACQEWKEISFYVNIGLLSASAVDLAYNGLKKLPGNTSGGITTEILNSFKSKLRTRVGNSPGFTLAHTDDEIRSILEKGKSLNLPNDEIDDFLFISCRDAKPITSDGLIQQMDNWVNVVQKRGYPYKFNDASQFQGFSGSLKSRLNDINIPTRDVRIQGSSLRTPNANDVDLVAMVNQSEFDVFVKTKYNGTISKDGVNIDLSDMTNQEMKNLANDIVANSSSYSRKALDNFAFTVNKQIINAKGSKNIIPGFKKLRDEMVNSYPNLNIENIAIQPVGSSFDLKPFINL